MDPKGKVALVTGGASGIGLAGAKELLENGAKVSICDIDAKAAEGAMMELTAKYGNRVMFIQVDVRDKESFEDAFKKTKSHFNGLDILYNNAGIFNENKWEDEIDINLKGLLRGTFLGFKYMGKDHGGNGGVIVNTGSRASFFYDPTFPCYLATKHGVLAFTKSLGTPLHYDRNGVRVVAFCPGSTDTPLFDSCVHTVRPEWVDMVTKQFQATVHQTAQAAGKSFLRMIREAKNGDAWVSEGGESYLVTIPEPKRTKL